MTPGAACYIPLSPGNKGELNLSCSGPRHLDEAHVLAKLALALQDDSILKVAHNLKFVYVLFGRRGIRMRSCIWVWWRLGWG